MMIAKKTQKKYKEQENKRRKQLSRTPTFGPVKVMYAYSSTSKLKLRLEIEKRNVWDNST